MTEDYAHLPLPQLEELARSSDLPPARRQAVEAELGRRYAEKWRSSAGPTPSAQQPGPPPVPPGSYPAQPPLQPLGPPPARPNPQAWGPPVPAVGTPAKTGGLAKPLGCLAAFLVAAVAVVVVAVLTDSDSAPPPRIGTVCVTRLGTCPMVESLPVGQSCVCRTPDGDVEGVIA
ncbi:hypothetical protein H4696_001499 [Amycolatopsis lexingtonensis]|uniref:Uncharacterized protein n=2 Tax=Amycolatopsis lexingtonensis TaxID=218822 RepID=A0ABR9HU04_9PSEU|nr:hypothetical protein [Amycolatopsis lexingtonensis]MBE1494399.1 hypothetical protein [Amycolatopsis lexingtonensis]